MAETRDPIGGLLESIFSSIFGCFGSLLLLLGGAGLMMVLVWI